jgi:hypothetical protein
MWMVRVRDEQQGGGPWPNFGPFPTSYVGAYSGIAIVEESDVSEESGGVAMEALVVCICVAVAAAGAGAS